MKAVKEQLTCPSYVSVENALIIGSIDSHKKTTFLNAPEKVTQEHMLEFNKDAEIENKVRFAGVCVKAACHQWSSEDHVCGLGARVQQRDLFAPYEDYANCTIKETCRWRKENGEGICPKCVNIIRYRQEEA